MLTTDQIQKLVAAAFFALPLVTVKVVDITLSEGGPAHVSAAQPAAAAPLTPLPTPTTQPANPAADTASDNADRQGETSFGPNPFYYTPTADSKGSSSASTADVTKPSSELLGNGDFTVQMIMSQPNGDWAVINGKTYSVGQRIGQSPWRLTAVDSSQRSVTLDNIETGQTLTRTVDLRHP